MFRRLVITLAATAVVTAGALAPSAASAKGWHHGHHWHQWHHSWRHFSGGVYLGAYPAYAGTGCYVVRKVVWTHHGRRVRRVAICD